MERIMTTSKDRPTVKLGLLAFALTCFFAIFQVPTAAAQGSYICPGGPGPGERQVGTTGGGNGVAAMPVCVSDGGGGYSGGRGSAPARVPYLGVAYHRDASDVWVAAQYPSGDAAMDAAQEACQAFMRDRCGATWQGPSGYIGVARAPNGDMIIIPDDTRGKVQRRIAESCKSTVLDCPMIGMFTARDRFRLLSALVGGGNVRGPSDISTVRRLYAAASWVRGADYDGTAWVASGYTRPEAAQEAALNLCRTKKANNPACEIVTSTGHGVLIGYSYSGGSGFLGELSEVRAREAMTKSCKQSKFENCTVREVFDARRSGTFETVIR
jgi:Domain of unknown function (DUF4189)